MWRAGRAALLLAALLGLGGSAFAANGEIIVSIADQELALVGQRRTIARFRISTSKFGTGDVRGSFRTPLGETFVSAKIGDHLASGAVIKNRAATGEM
ncbi:MAG: L,D-transpeptidase [Verrucomicrobiota bacterium]|nr:L,D-transpeptidase [Verrucomicrobiota bacterium]